MIRAPDWELTGLWIPGSKLRFGWERGSWMIEIDGSANRERLQESGFAPQFVQRVFSESNQRFRKGWTRGLC